MNKVVKWTSFQDLGGQFVSIDKVAEELKRWPLDGVLGFISCLSIESYQKGYVFFENQEKWFNLAREDDFPHSFLLLNKPSYLHAKRPIIIHELNLACLAHLALLHCQLDTTTPSFSIHLCQRICRLLLILNDNLNSQLGHIKSQTKDPDLKLLLRKKLVGKYLCTSQFNKYSNSIDKILSLIARQEILFHKYLPKLFLKSEEFFYNAKTCCSNLFFPLMIMFVSHFKSLDLGNSPWMDKENVLKDIKKHKDTLQRFIQEWTITPKEYRKKESPCGKLATLDNVYFQTLRESPLIEARSGQILSPCLPFLFSKIEDYIYYALTDYIRDHISNELMREFQAKFALAYERYAQDLIDFIIMNDSKPLWETEHNIKLSSNGEESELCDSYIQNSGIGICFEHKGGKPDIKFRKGENFDRVIGPNDEILEKLDKNISTELPTKEQDKSFLTQGIWQQNKHIEDLVNEVTAKFKQKPTKIYPILTHLHSFRIDTFLKVFYVSHLIRKTHAYPNSIWAGQPVWLAAEDLEKIAALAEKKELDLLTLLEEKNRDFPEEGFQEYWYKKQMKNYPFSKLAKTVQDLLDQASDFYKELPQDLECL